MRHLNTCRLVHNGVLWLIITYTGDMDSVEKASQRHQESLLQQLQLSQNGEYDHARHAPNCRRCHRCRLVRAFLLICCHRALLVFLSSLFQLDGPDCIQRHLIIAFNLSSRSCVHALYAYRQCSWPTNRCLLPVVAVQSLFDRPASPSLPRDQRRYGPLARIGPNQVLLSDPEESMRILYSRSRYERGPWYDAFKIEPDRSNFMSQRHRPTHMHMRFQMAPGVYLVESLR
jgi:hypothetical protein